MPDSSLSLDAILRHPAGAALVLVVIAMLLGSIAAAAGLFLKVLTVRSRRAAVRQEIARQQLDAAARAGRRA